jgi:hypothetical protein
MIVAHFPGVDDAFLTCLLKIKIPRLLITELKVSKKW